MSMKHSKFVTTHHSPYLNTLGYIFRFLQSHGEEVKPMLQKMRPGNASGLKSDAFGLVVALN